MVFKFMGEGAWSSNWSDAEKIRLLGQGENKKTVVAGIKTYFNRTRGKINKQMPKINSMLRPDKRPTAYSNFYTGLFGTPSGNTYTPPPQNTHKKSQRSRCPGTNTCPEKKKTPAKLPLFYYSTMRRLFSESVTRRWFCHPESYPREVLNSQNWRENEVWPQSIGPGMAWSHNRQDTYRNKP